MQDAKAIHDIWSCLPICTRFSQDFSSDKCFLLYFHGLEDNKWWRIKQVQNKVYFSEVKRSHKHHFWHLYCGNKTMLGSCEKGNFHSRADAYVDVHMKGWVRFFLNKCIISLTDINFENHQHCWWIWLYIKSYELYETAFYNHCIMIFYDPII